MTAAQRYHERAAHLRRLASTEPDVKVAQQLKFAAVGFDPYRGRPSLAVPRGRRSA
jgi:hypothetical protein